VFVRITRGSANAIWAREFVLAARASGKGGFRITIEHVLPNILPILIVQATIQFALAILAEAALSYLGLGTQPPQPSWGRMLNDAQTCCSSRRCSRSIRALRSPSPCSGSICWATGCATCSIRGWRGSGDERSATRLIEVREPRRPAQHQPRPGRAPRGVSFSLARGETLGLIGESGCGKSMTALALMGLLPDSAVISGSIRLDGSELVGLADATTASCAATASA
jgi:ABC-type multidrug transport system fused ATPase/permease subunit